MNSVRHSLSECGTELRDLQGVVDVARLQTRVLAVINEGEELACTLIESWVVDLLEATYQRCRQNRHRR